MCTKQRFFTVLTIASVLVCSSAYAATTKVKAKVPAGKRMLLVNGGVINAAAAPSEEKVVKLKIKKSTARVYVVNGSTGGFEGPIVLGYKKGSRVLSYSRAVEKKICENSKTKAVLAVKRPSGSARRRFINLGLLTERSGFFTPAKQIGKAKLAVKKAVAVNSNCVPLANAANLGFGLPIQPAVAVAATEEDADGDGLVNKFDVDDDNDGIMDQYDSETPDDANRFWIFSNLKVGIEDTVNANTGSTPTDSELDQLVSSNATLAIEVSGDQNAGETTELDCSGLTYCSAGGTGKVAETNDSFPGAAGGSLDSDGDGLGTITAGSTGDFQLFPGAKSTAIGSGDTYLQIVTTSTAKETQRVGMLNSIFNTIPALKQISIDTGGAATTDYTVSYPVRRNGPGTDRNCFTFPDQDQVSVTIEAWRPQRRGIAGAGEANFMDIGNSLITVDIPSAPCSGNQGCSGNGPGMCPGSAYSTSDANLTAHAEGLLDQFADAAANPANTFAFTLDLTACLNSAGLTLNSGERVTLDLQLRNTVGDNAAQKFCIERE